MIKRVIIPSFIVCLILMISGLFDVVNNLIYDTCVYLNQKQSPAHEIVILDIDNKSIKEIGYWPWDRSVYIELFEKIKTYTPAVIGVNLSFTETQGHPEVDQKLKTLFDSIPNLLLTTKFTPIKAGNITALKPEQGLFPAITKGHVFFEEKDVVRRFPPFKFIPAFSLVIIELYAQAHSGYKMPAAITKILKSGKLNNYTTHDTILIDYQRTTDKFKHISIVDFLKDKIPAEELKNKIVLIGTSDKYLTTFFATPFTRYTNYSSSTIELQAQIIDSLINYRGLQEVNINIQYLIPFVLGLLFLYFIKGRSIVVQIISLLLSLFVLFIADYFMYSHLAYWFPPAGTISILLIIYGFFTINSMNKLDKELLDSLTSLEKDENIPLSIIPSDVTLKVDTLKSLIQTIINDRKTIKTIMNSVNNGIIVLNNQGNIIWSNAKFLNVFKNSLVINSNIEELTPELSFKDIKLNIDINGLYKTEIAMQGSVYMVIITPLTSKEEGYIAILNDITELKEIDKLKTNTVRMITHELKIPITNIIMATDNISDFEDRKLILENNDYILNSANNMLNTITNFLDLNKLESKLHQINLKNINLNELLLKVINTHQLNAQNKNVKIVENFENSPCVFVDEQLIEIVLNNLVTNALKYSPEGGSVYMQTTLLDDKVKISVTDEGIGIDEDEIPKVINKFYRATNNELVNVKGSGIGLAIVKEILEAHESQLEITSKLNEGSTFAFTLKVSG